MLTPPRSGTFPPAPSVPHAARAGRLLRARGGPVLQCPPWARRPSTREKSPPRRIAERPEPCSPWSVAPPPGCPAPAHSVVSSLRRKQAHLDARGGAGGVQSEFRPGAAAGSGPPRSLTAPLILQGKQKDGPSFGEYGGWYKACKVDRCVCFPANKLRTGPRGHGAGSALTGVVSSGSSKHAAWG